VSGSDVIINAFTELAPRYEQVVDSEFQRFWGWSYAGFVERLIELAGVAADDRVLDVATGTAVIPRQLLEQGNGDGRIVGLDITFTMLRHAQGALRSAGSSDAVRLTCGSAMAMPFPEDNFDAVICGLGTHHMDVHTTLAEMRRVLRPGGWLTIADVAASPQWKLPGVQTLLKLVALLYYLPGKNLSRAWAEAAAVSNVRTADEWRSILAECGFAEVEVTMLPSRRFWSPSPLVLRATKH